MKEGKRNKPPRPLLEPVSEDGNSSFARALGSVDYHTRERGLQALTLYLGSRSSVSRFDMMKLWKGLFYCFWHSDKQPVQEELAGRLASILPQLQKEVAALYFATFLETMQREWFGIDRLRLDKFLMLVRKFLRQLFVFLWASNWDEEMVAGYCSVLHSLMKESDKQPAAGLSFQIADTAIPELLGVLREAGDSIPDEPLRQLLDAFVSTMAVTVRKTLVARIRMGTFEAIIEELQSMGQAGPLDQLDAAKLADDIFNKGASAAVKVPARHALYSLSHDLEGVVSKKRKRTDRQAVAQTQQDNAADDATPPARKKTKKHGGKSEKQAAAYVKAAQEASDPSGNDYSSEEQPAETAAAVGLKRNSKRAAKADRLSAAEAAKAKACGETLEKHVGRRSQGSVRFDEAEVLRDLASAQLKEAEEGGRASGGKGKKKKAKGLGTEAVTRAAERTLTAINAHKQGRTTVDPATPGSPSSVDIGGWFQDSLEAGTTRSLPSGAVDGTPPSKKPGATANGSPGSSAKRVKFSLKRNLYFGKDQPVPDSKVRTPESCRPKGSALKRVSKFPSPTVSEEGTPKGRMRKGKGRKAQARLPGCSGSGLQALFNAAG